MSGNSLITPVGLAMYAPPFLFRAAGRSMKSAEFWQAATDYLWDAETSSWASNGGWSDESDFLEVEVPMLTQGQAQQWLTRPRWSFSHAARLLAGMNPNYSHPEVLSRAQGLSGTVYRQALEIYRELQSSLKVLHDVGKWKAVDFYGYVSNAYPQGSHVNVSFPVRCYLPYAKARAWKGFDVPAFGVFHPDEELEAQRTVELGEYVPILEPVPEWAGAFDIANVEGVPLPASKADGDAETKAAPKVGRPALSDEHLAKVRGWVDVALRKPGVKTATDLVGEIQDIAGQHEGKEPAPATVHKWIKDATGRNPSELIKLREVS